MAYQNLITGNVSTGIKTILENPFENIPSIEEAIQISKNYKIALHPRYTYYWNELSSNDLITFLEKLKLLTINYENQEILDSQITVNDDSKRRFEILGIEHEIKLQNIEEIKSEKEVNLIIFNKETTKSILTNLGIYNFKNPEKEFEKQLEKLITTAKNNLDKKSIEILTLVNDIEIRDKGGSYIGARMGRPEKAKMRKLDGNPHGLFPIGEGKVTKTKQFNSSEDKIELKQNRLRNIIEAYKDGTVNSEFAFYYCESCDRENIYRICEFCNIKCSEKYYERYSDKEVRKDNEKAVRFKKVDLDIRRYVDEARKILGIVELPKLVKGMKSLSNKHHLVEHISKSFIRAKNGVFVNKDGTVRFDMIEMGLTHFKPIEIGTSIQKLKELGYTHDYLGNPLENENQLIEIFPQDVILPDCVESGDELASDFVINTGNFVDELLEKLYKMPKFYNFKTKDDTIGHLLIGLAPHTSAGIVGRLIGYSKTQGCFSHPVWHAAQRRNLDGDENGVMLLMDGLINFSREYLPNRRGAATMDTSLVLTSHLYLDQIDDEVHGMDIVDHYPLEFYRMNKEYKSPKEIKIEKVEKRMDEKVKDKQYLGYKFTHTTSNMNNTIMCSSYKSVPLMSDKMDMQLKLGKKIRAVDENQVGSFIIDKHFMKDIKGNLRKFGMQSFRCTNCNESYRRPPLNGRCKHCKKTSINFTIHEGSIKKYLIPSFDIVAQYDVDPYIVETLELVNLRIEGVFGKEKEKQTNLDNFFGK